MKIAIVGAGAGAGGSKLIEIFCEISSITIDCVVDKNLNSNGCKIANSKGIKCVDDIKNISEQVDMIIEATGKQIVLDQLNEYYGDRYSIVDSKAAELMVKIVDKQLESKNMIQNQYEKIKKTGEEMNSIVREIIDGTEKISDIKTTLSHSSSISMNLINQTDEIIRAVNKLTQQIKILGLNANIEAARAGEQGRGFSVVATEVQKMSDSTSAFALQISELLGALSTENNRTNDDISRLSMFADQQVEMSHNIKKIIEKLEVI